MKKLILAAQLLILSSVVIAQTKDLTRWVNPFIGTGGHGHTFPGATLPFGMVQLSPDTRIDNWDGSSGYHHSDDVIFGFSHTHLSGTGIPDGCDILLTPTTDPSLGDGYGRHPATFSHSSEIAEPGYYSVVLNSGIRAELTATSRVGFHRYTFPSGGNASIVVNLDWRDKVTQSELKIVGKHRIEGMRKSRSWAKDQTVYFAAEFSKPLNDLASTAPPPFKEPFGITTNFRFKVAASEVILVKVAISYVSIEGARENLEAELPGWDFDRVRADAKATWNRELSKIEVSGGTEDQTTNFYTALYHTMIHPNVFNDADGKYLGHDGKIHTLSAALPPDKRRSSASPSGDDNSRGSAAVSRRSRGPDKVSPRKSGAFALIGGRSPNPKSKIQNLKSNQYTVFSLWDTFRAAHPLYTIIDHRRTVDFINTFIRIYEQGGRLPVWELYGEETDTMIGYHAVPVIADAMAKDIKGFDYEKAYEAAKHSAELNHFGLAAYKRRGYISSEDENEAVSKTLEYAYDDWCLMTMASTLFNTRSFATGKSPRDDQYLKKLSEEIDYYRRRALSFENLFDTETRFFRPRLNGGFIKPFTPQEVTFHFTEGNAWQYSFFVPHDVTRLIELMGGTEKFIAKLDELFTTETKLSGRDQPDITGLIGQYAHGNEPSHHIAYLYDYAGVPSKTQRRVRQIMDEFYKPTPDGLIGNEDCGQMSAWYVLSASGFYPVLPGEKRYDLGTPLFKQIAFNLENGKRFTIRAPKVSATNIYINSVKWNGRPQPVPYITQDQIMAGGLLDLDMSERPNDKAFEHASTSTVYHDIIPVPIIEGDRVFTDKTTITMRTLNPREMITYTVDAHGEELSRKTHTYTGPFTISDTATVFAYSTAPWSTLPSKTVEAHFRKRPNDWTVKIVSPYSTQYTGGGDGAIVDGLRGTANFAAGEWQGYEGKTFEAIIDLQRETEIRNVGGSFLQSARSWIWMPDRIEFEASSDGTTFKKIAEIKPGFPQQDMEPATREFSQSIAPTKASYVRIRAYNFGKIPAWHVGAGGDPWIFVDEILIR